MSYLEVETISVQDVVAPLEDVHEAVKLDDEAAKVTHDVPGKGLAVGDEQDPFGLTGPDEALEECRLTGAVAAPHDQRLFVWVIHDLLGQSLEPGLVRAHLVAHFLGSKEGCIDLGAVIHLAVGEDVGVHVKRRLDAFEHIGVALLCQDEEASDGEVLGVEGAPTPGAVAVLVLLAPLAHLLPEAQRGSKLLQDHAYSNPCGVVVHLGDG